VFFWNKRVQENIALIALMFMLTVNMFPEFWGLVGRLEFGPRAAHAEWICGYDKNGDGYVDGEGEIATCLTTPEGQLCPMATQTCSSTANCPLDQTKCNTGNCSYQGCSNGTCALNGVCASQSIPVTQYQCPSTGTLYPALATCNSSCTQTAACSTSTTCPLDSSICNTGNCTHYGCNNGSCANIGVCSSQNIPVTQYQCPSTGTVYPALTTCNASCTQTATCNTTYTCPFDGAACSGSCSRSATCNLSTGTYTAWYAPTVYPKRLYETQAACVSATDKSCTSVTVKSYICPLTGTKYFGYLGNYSVSNGYYLTIAQNECNAGCTQTAACTSTTTCPLTGGSACVNGSCSSAQACTTYSSSTTKYNCAMLGTQYNTQSECTNACQQWGTCSTSSSCPLTGGSACSNGYCTAGQTCVTNSSTTTKYNCALLGTQYDNQTACTTACKETATCSSSYQCPAGSQYTCMNNGTGTMTCSPYLCQDTSGNDDDDDNIDDNMLTNDGDKDADGNCLSSVYIFTGRGMRCRPSGYSTGFSNCCNKAKVTSTDTLGTSNTAMGAIGAIKMAYSILEVAKIAGMMGEAASTGGSVSFIFNSSTGVANVSFFNAQGVVTSTYTVSGEQAIALNAASGQMAQGSDAAINAALSNFAAQVGPQIAVSVLTSLLIDDPVIAGAINIVAMALMGAGPLGIAMAVVSLVMQLFTPKCDQLDIETSGLVKSNFCHFVGDYCAKKWPLIGCVQKAKGYCCFNSKMGRIIHEQGRPQLEVFGSGGGWGTGKSPNCRGFLPEEFQSLDFSKIDLSEYFGDIEKALESSLTKATNTVSEKLQKYYENIQK